MLQYGHDLPIPIPDLEVDDYGVRATLSFSRTAHLTVVPWSAVYVVACDRRARRALRRGRARRRRDHPLRPVSDTASPDFDLGVPCEDDLMLPARRAARLRSIPASADTATALEDEQPTGLAPTQPTPAPRRQVARPSRRGLARAVPPGRPRASRRRRLATAPDRHPALLQDLVGPEGVGFRSVTCIGGLYAADGWLQLRRRAVTTPSTRSPRRRTRPAHRRESLRPTEYLRGRQWPRSRAAVASCVLCNSLGAAPGRELRRRPRGPRRAATASARRPASGAAPPTRAGPVRATQAAIEPGHRRRATRG